MLIDIISDVNAHSYRDVLNPVHTCISDNRPNIIMFILNHFLLSRTALSDMHFDQDQWRIQD